MKKSTFGRSGEIIRCIMGEIMTRRILFDGRGSNYTQIEKIYERVGDPLESWPEARGLPLWNEIKPRKNYCNTLEDYLRQFTTEITPDCIDLMQKLLTYNPDQRISASAALEHEFFRKEPRMCTREEFPQFKKEFHYLLLKNAEANPVPKETQLPFANHEFSEARPPRKAYPGNSRLSSVLELNNRNGEGPKRDQDGLAKRNRSQSGFNGGHRHYDHSKKVRHGY